MISWGIIGCGWVVRDYVAPAMKEAENATVTSLLDPSPAALDATERILPGAEKFSDMQDFFDNGEMDAVYVATPNHLHRDAVVAAARAGKHVLCEKPMATSMDEAEEMVAACREAGVIYATAFDQRFHAAHIRLREIVAGGALGTVCSVRIRYACWLPPDWTPDGSGSENWRVNPKLAGGGAFMDLAPHGLDLAQNLLGERLVETKSIFQNRVFDYAVEDGATLIGSFESGALLTQQVAYNTPDEFPRRELEVVGTKAMAIATDTMGQTPGGTLELVHAEDGRHEEIVVSGAERSPFLNQVEAFGAALDSGSGFPYPPEYDLATMEIIVRTMRENSPEGMPR